MGILGMNTLPSVLLLAGSGSVLLGYIVWQLRNILQAQKLRRTPSLAFSKIRVFHPSASHRKGGIRIKLMNTRGGEATLKTLSLRVAGHGASLNPLKLRQPQIMPGRVFTVDLRSDCTHYPLPIKPRRLGRQGEVDIAIEFTCDEQHWFRMALDARWQAGKSSASSEIISSGQFYLEFPVS